MVYARVIIYMGHIYVLCVHSAAISPPEKKLKKNSKTPLRISTAYGRLCSVETTTDSTVEL